MTSFIFLRLDPFLKPWKTLASEQNYELFSFPNKLLPETVWVYSKKFNWGQVIDLSFGSKKKIEHDINPVFLWESDCPYTRSIVVIQVQKKAWNRKIACVFEWHVSSLPVFLSTKYKNLRRQF